MTALTGTPITAAKLLGEDDAKPALESRKKLRAAERAAERKMERMLQELEQSKEKACPTL